MNNLQQNKENILFYLIMKILVKVQKMNNLTKQIQQAIQKYRNQNCKKGVLII